ncbi:MAG: hypothetical protein ACOH1E_07335 [Brevundimonas sp.]
MTEPDKPTPDSVDKQAERLKDDADAMKRPDRAIPLADDDEDDDGVGEITGLVP